jgi:hypothetical protein
VQFLLWLLATWVSTQVCMETRQDGCWCFHRVWQLFLSTKKRTYQHHEAAFITCISDTQI